MRGGEAELGALGPVRAPALSPAPCGAGRAGSLPGAGGRSSAGLCSGGRAGGQRGGNEPLSCRSRCSGEKKGDGVTRRGSFGLRRERGNGLKAHGQRLSPGGAAGWQPVTFSALLFPVISWYVKVKTRLLWLSL